MNSVKDFRGKIEPPVEKEVLKIERYAQRLTQGYRAHGGSYLWAPGTSNDVINWWRESRVLGAVYLNFKLVGFFFYELDVENIYILLTKHEGRTGRISARGLDSTDLAALGPDKKDRGPMFSQYGPEQAWLIRDLLYD